MNDNTKTITFVVIALAALLIAWVGRPTLPESEPEEMIGQALVEDFNPLSATSLDILKYDEDSATVVPFSVAQVDGVWSIPSHDDYPADAKDHLAEAAAGLLGHEILSVATETPGEHGTYDVIEPDQKDPKKGMGTAVTMKNDEGKTLLSLVIGKEVPDRPELRYVRRAGQDPVYTAAIKTDKLSTNFDDWIEKNLLKMSTWDIQQVEIHDHSVDVLNMALIQRGRMALSYDDTGDPKWKMVDDEVFAGEKWVPVKMADDEELNTSKLDDLKFALDDLKIVDVNPKPPGLSADLKAAESFISNREAIESLATRGFYVAKLGNEVQLFSNEGEIRIGMKDGVEYILRFGGISGSTAGEKPEKKDDEKEGEEESSTAGLNRFIFVTTEFNPEAIEKPTLEPLPEEKPESKPEAKPEGKPEAKPEAKPDGKPDDAAKPEEKPEDLKAERERIEKENKRKQDEYDEKIAEGKKHVAELNARFADWYYIIPDDVYQKIHLSRKDLVKKKETPEEKDAAAGHEGHGHGPMPVPGDTPGDFNELKGKIPAPAKPATKPEPPATKPKTPAAKPATPETKPEPAPAKPEAPKAKPAPAAKPKAAETKSAPPVTKPEPPVAKP